MPKHTPPPTDPRLLFFSTPWGPLRLDQQGPDDFTVTYGKETRAGLSYGEAARQLGQAILHWLSCEDVIDNRDAS